MIWFIVNMIVLMGCTICYLDNEFFAWCKSMFLYERVRFVVLFMTILTDNNRFFVVKCRYKDQVGSCGPWARHVIFRSVADHVHEVQSFAVRSCVISEVISGSLFSEITQTLRGWPLYRQTRLRTKLEILSPCANAHYASATASACKTSQFKAFL